MQGQQRQPGSRQVLFHESGAAARSLKSAWTRLGSSYGCIQVTLCPDALFIRPHRLAGWICSLLALDLRHAIGVKSIVAAEPAGRWGPYGRVDLTFLDAGGQRRNLQLFLRQSEAFLDKLNGLL